MLFQSRAQTYMVPRFAPCLLLPILHGRWSVKAKRALCTLQTRCPRLIRRKFALEFVAPSGADLDLLLQGWPVFRPRLLNAKAARSVSMILLRPA